MNSSSFQARLGAALGGRSTCSKGSGRTNTSSREYRSVQDVCATAATAGGGLTVKGKIYMVRSLQRLISAWALFVWCSA